MSNILVYIRKRQVHVKHFGVHQKVPYLCQTFLCSSPRNAKLRSNMFVCTYHVCTVPNLRQTFSGTSGSALIIHLQEIAELENS